MRKRNRNLQKNQGSPSQRKKKKKNEARKSAPQRNQNLPIRNESEPSAHCFWAEYSDKRPSAQYLRPNFQPIYHLVNDLKVRPNQPQGSNFAFKVRSIQKSYGWNRFWSRIFDVKDENLCYLFSSKKCPAA